MRTPIALLILAFAMQSPALAEDAVVADPNTPTERPADDCALYGSGYVRLANSQTCVRISGKVRVDVSAGKSKSDTKN